MYRIQLFLDALAVIISTNYSQRSPRPKGRQYLAITEAEYPALITDFLTNRTRLRPVLLLHLSDSIWQGPHVIK